MAIEEQENTIPTPFLVVLILWLAAMFASFGLFAPRNAIAVAVLFLGALSLSGAIFLIEELNDPLGGIISIPRSSNGQGAWPHRKVAGDSRQGSHAAPDRY